MMYDAFLMVDGDDDDVSSLVAAESDTLLFPLSSSNSYHVCVFKIYSDPPLFSMMQNLLLMLFSDLNCIVVVIIIAFFSSTFNLVW